LQGFFSALALLLLLAIGFRLDFRKHGGRPRSNRKSFTAKAEQGPGAIIGTGRILSQPFDARAAATARCGGCLANAKHIELDWTPLAYLEGLLQIDRLHVAGVEMERLPQGSSARGSAEASILASMWPRLPSTCCTWDLNWPERRPRWWPAAALICASVRDMLFDGSARRIDGEGEYESLALRWRSHGLPALKLHEPAGGPLENIRSLPGSAPYRLR